MLKTFILLLLGLVPLFVAIIAGSIVTNNGKTILVEKDYMLGAKRQKIRVENRIGLAIIMAAYITIFFIGRYSA